MSDPIFPDLPGLTWSRSRTPQFKSLIQTSASDLDSAISLTVYPRWKYGLSYEFLRSDAVYAELQSLVGLFLKCRGRAFPFLFSDWEDNAVQSELIGTGDGATRGFQLCRTYAGFTEPVLALNGSPTIYVNGSVVSSGWTMDGTMLTFGAAPGDGATITGDYQFYWRCRFLEDVSEFENFMYKLWTLKKIEFQTLKLGSE